MTVAISIKVNDGIVLASDSATTIIGKDPKGKIGIVNIYQNADKIFNLRKGSPIGAITWGSGSIGNSSISTLIKDFRNLISDGDEEWKIDPLDYTIEDIAKKLKKFIYDINYLREFKDWTKEVRPFIGFLIVGYSSKADFAEEWEFNIEKGECKGPDKIRENDQSGISWRGQGDAIHRLYFGFDHRLNLTLKNLALDDKIINQIINQCRSNLVMSMVLPAMPIQDVIDLSKYLVELSIQYFRFIPGAGTVGGPIEIAAITKHEHFKWVKRKHYYKKKLNPINK